MPVTPHCSIYGRQYEFRLDPANMLEVIFQDPLFGGHLRSVIHVLEAATAAQPEVRALWRYSCKPRLNYLLGLGQLEAGLLAISVESNDFARQGAFYEDYLASCMGNPTAFLIERFDNDGFGHTKGTTSTDRGIPASGVRSICLRSSAPGRIRFHIVPGSKYRA